MQSKQNIIFPKMELFLKKNTARRRRRGGFVVSAKNKEKNRLFFAMGFAESKVEEEKKVPDAAEFSQSDIKHLQEQTNFQEVEVWFLFFVFIFSLFFFLATTESNNKQQQQ